ncbi:hypothetical protein HJC23_003368 [Cyclotella cryptica]|uniref:Fe2OG dioxygenase domain-containing protein n=1 Tax=Cyclotella cryptica TaxID=29204 RepID=A0ABD3R9A9_9STRA|eukprot:CCRYP_000944-RA/>CCRYP_000944-RA protein AED:0.29 eAED:0.29 QI:0/-1/0/1/-1/1/1/0/421
MTAATSISLLHTLIVLLHTTTTNVSAITSTSCFAVKRVGGAGNGFGIPKSKSGTPSTPTKVKNKKRKSGILLEELKQGPPLPPSPSSSSASNEAPKLDRFGLPIITEEDVFPPLSHDIPRVPVQHGTTFDRDTMAKSMEKHLGINLDIFDDQGYSLHTEATTTTTTDNDQLHSTRWKLQLLHHDPPVVTIDNFFTPQECQDYISMAIDPTQQEQYYDASKILQVSSPTFSSSSVSRRTSTTWFCAYNAVPTLLAKATHLLRNVTLGQCEEAQIVRYRTGEEFSWHYDETPPRECGNGGQRLATLLVYLNDLGEGRGGGTVFRDLLPPGMVDAIKMEQQQQQQRQQLTVRPAAGKALLFFPAYNNGAPDVRTLHKGEVALDTKMIAQLWIHEREYKASVPRGNCQEDALERVEEERVRLGFV